MRGILVALPAALATCGHPRDICAKTSIVSTIRSVTPTSVGAHQIVACYPGDTTFAPGISTSVTLARSGRQLRVKTLGSSPPAKLPTPPSTSLQIASHQIQTADVTIDMGAIFARWYSQTASATHGSTLLYTQAITLDDDASVADRVIVTHSNGIGTSASGSSQ